MIANSGTALTERQINLIWKFYPNAIICLDGDDSGQKAAYRIAERLFPLINEKQKIYFSIMPDGKDPDDYIKQNGKKSLIDLLKKKEIIQSYIWNYHLSKIDQSNPYEISKFEKEIKKLAFSINDETLKKYVLEDFLEKIKNLTPNQNSRQSYNFFQFKKNKNFKILKETKILHQKKENLSKIQIIESSILYIIMNYAQIASKKLEQLSSTEFLEEKNENLKTICINHLTDENKKEDIKSIVNKENEKILDEVKENSNIQIITENKSNQEIAEILEELMQDHRDQSNLKKIESLEEKLINNLDENSYSELIKLKSQLNRD